MENNYSLILSGSYEQNIISAYLDVECKFHKINYYTSENKPVSNIILLDYKKEPVTKLYNDTKYYFATICKDTNKLKLLKIDENSLVFKDEDIDYRTIYMEVPWGQDFKFNDIRGRSFILVNNKPLIEYLGTDIVQPRLSLSPITKNGLINMEDTSYIVRYEEPINIQLDKNIKNVKNNNNVNQYSKENYDFNFIFFIIIITVMVIISIILLCLAVYKRMYKDKNKNKNINYINNNNMDILK